MRPTAKPTPFPTSARPTVTVGELATAAPTLSLSKTWSLALTADLQTVNTDVDRNSRVVYRKAYYELLVPGANGTGIEQVYGGCQAWHRWLVADMFASTATSIPLSVQYFSRHALSAGLSNATEHVSTVCSNRTMARQMVALLTSRDDDPLLPLSSFSSNISTFECGGSIWSFRNDCGMNMSAPALCVNCSDPCAADNRMAVAPCNGSPPVAPVSSILSIAFEDIDRAPEILKFDVKPLSRGCEISLSLDRAGVGYCAVFASQDRYPSSLDAIAVQNHVAATSATTNSLTITVTGLTPLTTYKAFCFAQSHFGARTVPSLARRKPKHFATLCCRRISIGLSVDVVHVGEDVSRFLSVGIEGGVARGSLVVHLTVHRVVSREEMRVIEQNSSSPPTLLPALFSFPAGANPSATVWSSGLMNITEKGVYMLAVNVSGTASAAYVVESPWQASSLNASIPFAPLVIAGVLEVVEVDASLPAPAMTAASFSADGASMSIKFSRDTNRGETSTEFPCHELFEFPCANVSACQWNGLTAVTARVAMREGCAAPGLPLRLSPSARIRANCERGCDSHSTWPFLNQTSSIVIANPSVVLPPVVAISAADTVTNCNPLLLDVASSTGSGGRPWAKVGIAVGSVDIDGLKGNTTTLQRFLSQHFTISTPTFIPADLLLPGQTYNFEVHLCNFLGGCAIGSKRVSVLSEVVPTVFIPGDSLRTIRRKSALSIRAVAKLPTCVDLDSAVPSLVFEWKVSRGGVPELEMTSSSKDPSRFLLPGYSLQPNTMYEITVHVTALDRSASATSRVFVAPGEVVAMVAGGVHQSVRVREVLQLDASGSHDEDLYMTDRWLPLRFQWTCRQVLPRVIDSCSSLFANDTLKETSLHSVLRLEALELAEPFSKAELSLVVQDINRVRSSSVMVSVLVLPQLSPVISLVSNPSISSLGDKINAGQPLQLVASVNVPAMLDGRAEWSVDDTLGLNASSMVLLSSYLNVTWSGVAGEFGSRVLTFFLPINTAALPVGQRVAFTLSCRLQTPGVASSLFIDVPVNSPPRPGRFSISPEGGEELTLQFTFFCEHWVDDDLPLSYQFGFLSSSQSEMVIRTRLTSAFALSSLPAGSDKDDYRVSAFAQVFDALNGETKATSYVRVTLAGMMTAAEIESFVEKGLSTASTNVDDIKQAAALSSYLLNKVNCSLAPPDCSVLNRMNCYRTPHTCGECLSDSYIGDEGDSNEPCLPASAWQEASRRPHSLKSVMDLHRLFSNDSSDLEVEMKLCASNCSGHGSCLYYSSISGAEVAICPASAVDCVAQCSCDDGFAGKACALTLEELDSKARMRELVVGSLQLMTSLQDVDEQSLQSLMSSLKTVSQFTDEMTVDASQKVLDMALYSMSSISATNLGVSSTKDVLSAIDSALVSSTSPSSASALRRRLQVQTNGSLDEDQAGTVAVEPVYHEQVVTTVMETLNKFAEFVGSTMAPDQDPVTHAQSMFRVSVMKYSLGAASSTAGSIQCDRNTSINLPRRSAERAAGALESSLVMPLCSGAGGNQSSSTLSVTLSSLSASVFPPIGVLRGDDTNRSRGYQGDLMQLSLSSNPCPAEDPNCFVTFLMNRQRFSNRSYVEPQAEVANVSCATAVWPSFIVHHLCPDGQYYEVSCAGNAKTVQVVCPVTVEQPRCTVLEGDEEVDYGCVAVDFDLEHVTCSCPLRRSMLGVGSMEGHRLSAATNASVEAFSGPIAVNYAAMLKAITSSFTSTVLSSKDLDSGVVARGYQALVTLGVFTFIVAVGMTFSHMEDSKAKKVDPNAEKKENKLHSWLEAMALRRQRGRDKAGKVERREKKGFLDLAQDALPQVLSNRSFLALVKEELKRHHRWAGVIFHFSDTMPRVLRVTSLATNIVIMLFMQSITYNLTNGDDGSCEQFSNEVDCVEPRSSFATGESKCYWTLQPTALNGGVCAFVQPGDSIKVVLFVAVFSALACTPIALLADYVIFNYLAAPTRSSVKDLLRKRSTSQLMSIAPSPPVNPSPARVVAPQKAANDLQLMQVAQDDFVALSKALKRHFLALSEQEQRDEFQRKYLLFMCLGSD